MSKEIEMKKESQVPTTSMVVEPKIVRIDLSASGISSTGKFYNKV
jgi:hypothetical protein